MKTKINCKRTFALLLVFALVVGMLPITVFAAPAEQSQIDPEPWITIVSVDEAEPSTSSYNSYIDYTVTAGNDAAEGAWENVIATVILPDATTYASSRNVPADVTVENDGDTVIIDFGDIDGGTSKSVTIRVQVSKSAVGGSTMESSVSATGDNDPDGSVEGYNSVNCVAPIPNVVSVFDKSRMDEGIYTVITTVSNATEATATWSNVVLTELTTSYASYGTFVENSVTVDGISATMTLKSGKYTLSLGDIAPGESITIVFDILIDSDYQGKSVSNSITATDSVNKAYQPFSAITTTFVPFTHSGSITIYKVDEEGNALSRAVFGFVVSDSNPNPIVVTDINGDKVEVVDGQSRLMVDEYAPSIHSASLLPYGTYYIQEVAAPDGYELDDTVRRFVIESGNSSPSDKVENSLINSYTPTCSIRIDKADENYNPIFAPAVFGFVDIDGNPIIVSDAYGNTVNVNMTNWQSQFEYQDSYQYICSDLPYGTYYVREMTAPEGYTLDTTVYKIVCDDANLFPSITIVNFPISNPPAPSYSIEYEFVSNDETIPLPQEVLDLLPNDANTYTDGDTVTPITLENVTVATDDGTWTFTGWDEDSKTVGGEDVTFTGTWTFMPNEPEPYIKKVSDVNEVEIGGYIQYTITAGNNEANSTWKNVTVMDVLPGTVTYVKATAMSMKETGTELKSGNHNNCGRCVCAAHSIKSPHGEERELIAIARKKKTALPIWWLIERGLLYGFSSKMAETEI